VFSAGIGEKSQKLRKSVVDNVACLGFEIDDDLNGRELDGVVKDIGKNGASHRVLVCHTDEQFEMARGCAADQKLWHG
jgi:acetate kinase